jgi:hypothetical protein
VRWARARESPARSDCRASSLIDKPAKSTIAMTPIEDVLSSSRLAAFLVLLGVALRVWAYAANTSLYLDEILLSRSIFDLPLGSLLTKPLLLDQVAPRGFLLFERLAMALIGPNELALRLFPFLCAIAALLLFHRLASRMLTGGAPAVALFLFAIGVPFIRFGADVKQYEVDVAAAIGLLVLALTLIEPTAFTRRRLLVGLSGFIVIWFSQASVLVMGGIGAALAVEWLISRDRRCAGALLFTVSLWAVASLVAIAAGLRAMTPSTREFMQRFWAGGFFPLPIRSLASLRWFWDRLTSLFSDPTLLRYRWPAVFLIVAVVGIIALWRRSRLRALLLLGPLVVCMGAAIAQQYPFRGRLIVWLLPSVLLAVGAGVEWIWDRASLLHPAFAVALAVAFLALPLLALAQAMPPYEIEHHRDLLSYLERNRQPGDLVYVLPLQEIGTEFYGPRYGLMRSEWTTGICDAFETRPYLQDVDRYRGVRRLWILAGAGTPFRVPRGVIQSYLNTIGVKKDSLSLPSLTAGSVSIELYDLSDPVRLNAATADKFPAPPMPADPRPGCRDWVRAGAGTAPSR